MKFEVSSSDLLKKLQIAAGVIVPNPLLPISEDLLFVLEGNVLHVTATNVDTTVITSAEVNGIENGSIAVPAKMLLETLKALPDQPISFVVNDDLGIEITSSFGKYYLTGDNANEFPKLPEEEVMENFTFDAFKLAQALSKTVTATSNDEMRPAMTGVLMKVDFNKVIFVATDAHRLVKYTFGNINTEVASSVILPKKAINLLKNSLPEGGTVDIRFNLKNAIFQFGPTKLITKLVDGKYPDFNAVIPVENPNILVVNKKDFQSSLRRILIYANKSTNQVLLTLADNSLTISTKDLDFSNEAIEQLSCKYEGSPMVIGYNAKVLAEQISNIDTDEAQLHLSVPNRAGILYPGEQEAGEELLLLVMPIMAVYA